VAPKHYVEGVAVRVADRFFVVELDGQDVLWTSRLRVVRPAPAAVH
jgi:hypothetical protein